MGAEPSWATLSLSLPSSDSVWLEGFAGGLYRLADRYNVALVGGDTVRGPLAITISIMGFVETDRWLTRSGAKPGDTIFVSGCPGEAAAGLAVVQREITRSSAADFLVERFLWPEPRVVLGRSLRSIASAAIDVSDGLLADLEHICTTSHCGARIEAETLPGSSQMQAVFSPIENERFILAGGDDYELLFTVPPERMLEAEAAIAGGVRCVPIGRMTESREIVCCRGGAPIPIERRGYDHFA
jgi:thiamine-monophosphate kinase